MYEGSAIPTYFPHNETSGVDSQKDKGTSDEGASRADNRRNCLACKRWEGERMRYQQVARPDWYTGNGGSSLTVSKHVAVWCEAHGKTQVPDGFEIHHWDGNPRNNDSTNLTCVSPYEHYGLHHPDAPRSPLVPVVKPVALKKLERERHLMWGAIYNYPTSPPKVKAPRWMRGVTSSLVPLSWVIYCHANDIQSVPIGFIVGYRDNDNSNYQLDNLELISRSEQSKRAALSRWRPR